MLRVGLKINLSFSHLRKNFSKIIFSKLFRYTFSNFLENPCHIFAKICACIYYFRVQYKFCANFVKFRKQLRREGDEDGDGGRKRG
jgi:hypothetical protein